MFFTFRLHLCLLKTFKVIVYSSSQTDFFSVKMAAVNLEPYTEIDNANLGNCAS